MRWMLLSCLLYLIGCGTPTISPATFDLSSLDISSGQIDTLKKYISLYPNSSQFSIAIVHGDNLNRIGLIRQENVFSFIQNFDAIYEIGSITKTFTATLLSKSNIPLDSPIKDYLKFSMNPGDNDPDEITFLQLANHTSGLPRLPNNILKDVLIHRSNPYKNYDQKDLDDYLKHELKLDSKAGLQYSYSNLGGGILGNILANSAELTYPDYVKKELLIPHGFHQTFTNSNNLTNLIKGINGGGKEVNNWDFDALAGAGSLLSSLDDMIKYVQLQMSDTTYFRTTHIPTFNINATEGVSLGWHIKMNESGTSWYWHNGGTGGYTSCIIFDTSQQNAIIVLSNMSALAERGADTDKLAFALMKELLSPLRK